MSIKRICLMAVALLSVGFIAGFVAGLVMYLAARFLGILPPFWVYLAPAVFGLAWLYGWAFGRWPDGPDPREAMVAAIAAVPLSVVLGLIVRDTPLVQATVWMALAAAVFYGGVLSGIGRRAATARYRGAPV
jgi:hypothetical protein